MDIETTLRVLGELDVAALRDAILAQNAAAWEEDRYRREEYYVPPEYGGGIDG